jgi:hypothetical protein
LALILKFKIKVYMKLLFYMVPAIVLAACGSNGDKTSEIKDTTSHESHAMTTTEMPPMPEIPENAKVFFANMKDGQTVTSPVKVEMGVMALSVDTANGILKPASGHHHILVDMDSIPAQTVVPPTDSVKIFHFGNAQTTAEIKLPAGQHKLTLQFADALHRSYGSRLARSVTVNVNQ